MSDYLDLADRVLKRIAAELNVAVKTLRKFVYEEYGADQVALVRERHFTDDELALITQLRAEGVGLKRIALQVGAAVKTLRKLVTQQQQAVA